MLIILPLLLSAANGALPPTCDSQVYCQGPLLHAVQMAKIFNDSKTFVDLKMNASENQTLENFQDLMEKTNGNPTFEDIQKFVSDNFEDGKELEQWTPPDFKPEPAFLNNIQDPDLRAFGKDIVDIWKILARKVKPEVAENPSQYSLMYLPYGFIIPGGRFKEIYYWDTYWIIKGLLISEMTDTAKGMIENLMYLVKKVGHVPNGSRKYYNERSQPPLLTAMAKEYVTYTKDYEWLAKNIDVLEKELKYWLDNRVVYVTKGGMMYRMFHYNAPSLGPRPESYREDFTTAQKVGDAEKVYIELKSGAESGWDFSSRWFIDSLGGNQGNLTNLHTTRIIPVDLNAFLCDAFYTLAQFFEELKDTKKAALWRAQARVQDVGINAILWNERNGTWFDYDVRRSKHRPFFYPSNITPLVTKCGAIHKTDRSIKKMLKYLKANKIMEYLGGTPTSLMQTGEQWDFPNAWPPLQSIVINGLASTSNAEAKDLAFQLAQNWVRANLIGFKETKEMFEKYDAEHPGKYGGGGEYVVQAGFGWTNGVVTEMLQKYGKKLTVK